MASLALTQHLRLFLAKREPPKTFCPSEVARALTAEEMQELGFTDWREAMPAVRELAWEMRWRGECEVLQRGEVVGGEVRVEEVRGPIRLRRREGGG